MKSNLKDKLISFGLSLATMLTLSACSDDEIKCNIEDTHIHLYVSDKGYQTYCNSENEYVYIDGTKYYKKDSVMYPSFLEEKFYTFLFNKDLISLGDYYYHFIARYPKNEDYTLYEYEYTDVVYQHWINSNGEPEVRVDYVTEKAWTKDPYHSGLTGKTKLMSTGYVGYRVYYNEETRSFQCEKSGYYNTIEELYASGYDFVQSENMCDEVEKDDIIYNSQRKLN